MEQLGADDTDDKANVWNREGCGDVQWILCDKGNIRYVSAWGVWDDVDQEKDIGPSTARDMPLRNSSKTRRLEMFMLFVVIWMVTSTRYSV